MRERVETAVHLGGRPRRGAGLAAGGWAPLWMAAGVAGPAAAGLLLSAVANRLSLLGCGLAVALLAAVWLSRVRAARTGAIARRALAVAGVAALALGAIATSEAEALTLGSAAVLGGTGLEWIPRGLLIAGGTLLAWAAAWAISIRRPARRDPPGARRRAEGEVEDDVEAKLGSRTWLRKSPRRSPRRRRSGELG